jgi:two-component system NtrC family response regulator
MLNTRDAASRVKLLVVEDDENIRMQMKWAFSQEYEVLLAEDRPSALEVVKKEHPAVVTLDLGLPPQPGCPEEGFLTLAGMLEREPMTKVIVITGQTERENAIQAIGQGAYDFLCKPIEVEELKGILRRAFFVAQLQAEGGQRRESEQSTLFEGMVGSSPQMLAVFEHIRKVAPSDAPVLISGESGTGKELVARGIHRLSARNQGPFVAINCGAIPENLLESELFGHEKGAFTGAHTQRKGRVEGAGGGTLFLDEIGELPLPLQVKLLRFLQEHVIERVGGRVEIPVDARIIAATHVDLKKAMSEGRFREDLYYRLGVVTLSLPPLRERTTDLSLLAETFLQQYAAEYRKKVKGFHPRVQQALLSYAWPGNVRELENRIKRAVIMSEGVRITPEDLEFKGEEMVAANPLSLKDAREKVEKEFVQKAMLRHQGNLSRVAAELGVSRPTLYDLMEKFDLGKKAGELKACG